MRIVLVFSHGGHYTEMQEFMDCFSGHEASCITYRSDATASLTNTTFLQPFRYSPLWLLSASCTIFRHMMHYRPQVIISTGAEPAIPAFLIGKLAFHSKLAFIECSAQVTSPSITGRLVYPLADLFMVQWETLLQFYGRKAQHVGGLI